MICSVPSCGKPHRAKGYCNNHWYRWKRHGDPLGGRRPNGFALEWIDKHLSHEGNSCLIWPFSRTENGYGTVRFNGRQQLASKVVCEKLHGPPPTARYQAAHSCGKGADGCVSPNHIRWRTRSDNNLEKELHGTLLRGSDIHRSKLSEDDVLTIRRQLREGRRIKEIAETFGVHRVTVAHIRDRKIWAWVPDGDGTIINSEAERKR